MIQFFSIGQTALFSSVQNKTRIFIPSPLCWILFSHQRSFTSMIIPIVRKKFIQNNLRNKRSKQMMIRDCRVYRISSSSSSLETKSNINLKYLVVSLFHFYFFIIENIYNFSILIIPIFLSRFFDFLTCSESEQEWFIYKKKEKKGKSLKRGKKLNHRIWEKTQLRPRPTVLRTTILSRRL